MWVLSRTALTVLVGALKAGPPPKEKPMVAKTERIPFFTKQALIAANDEAVRAGRNRFLYGERLATLPDDMRFPVIGSQLHNDTEVRCVLVVFVKEEAGKQEPVYAFLDMPIATYNALPVGIIEDGRIVRVENASQPADAPAETLATDSSVDDDAEDEGEEQNPEPRTVFKCEDCEGMFEEEDLGPALYECGKCGEVFNHDNSQDGDSHRCPQCSKFGSKQEKVSCPDCTGGRVEEIVAYACPDCDELHEDEKDARTCCKEA